MESQPTQGGAAGRGPANEQLAARLEEIADLLELQRADSFRTQAYRAAARTLRELPERASELHAREGQAGLVRLPTIGGSIARTLSELIETGRSGLLQRLHGAHAPEGALTTVAGIGPELAHRIHEDLGCDSLADLETAAWDGRLERVRGMGPRRVRMVRDSLAARLGRGPSARRPAAAVEAVDVAELLDVDAQYRAEAAAGRLARIAPRRFNPRNDAWLPVLHTSRGARHYTALYSNTARAHELGKTADWVVLFRDDHGGRGQWTVVTARRGPLAGRRVVRGRERECRAFYAADARAERASAGGRPEEPAEPAAGPRPPASAARPRRARNAARGGPAGGGRARGRRPSLARGRS